jgi:hypothetical protein
MASMRLSVRPSSSYASSSYSSYVLLLLILLLLLLRRVGSWGSMGWSGVIVSRNISWADRSSSFQFYVLFVRVSSSLNVSSCCRLVLLVDVVAVVVAMAT